MIPLHYLDIDLHAEAGLRKNGEDESGGIPLPVQAGAVLRVLHGAFKQNPTIFALALPKHRQSCFSRLRIFTGSSANLEMLRTAIKNHHIIRDYAQLSPSLRVPEKFDGMWTSYRRFRIPTTKSDRKPGAPLRERRMQEANAAKMPFFLLQSKSNGQCFGLYLQILEKGEPSLECAPDSYGLAVSSRPFSLPDLP